MCLQLWGRSGFKSSLGDLVSLLLFLLEVT